MERSYVFNHDGNNGNGGGSTFDIMALATALAMVAVCLPSLTVMSVVNT